jgi:hypothetical protein
VKRNDISVHIMGLYTRYSGKVRWSRGCIEHVKTK